jgi:hypothetical protein
MPRRAPRHARSTSWREKKLRRVKLGENILLIFENELLIRYQIQEMLRVEKIFEEDGIRHELETYAPLVPDGHNFKVTMQIEYPDEAQRRTMLARAQGRRGPRLGAHRWPALTRCSPSPTRTSSARTRKRPRRCISCASSSAAGMVAAGKEGAAISVGVDHPAYTANTGALPEAVRASLASDLR